MNRTIKELAEMNGRVYVYFADIETGNKFMAQAESEGFTFADGVKPTERDWDNIMAINRDMTINFVGTNGKIAFGCGVKNMGNKELIRIDFKKYSAGDKDYFFNLNRSKS